MSASRIVLFADGGVGVGAGHIFRLYPVFRCLCAMGGRAEMWVPLPQEELNALGLEGVYSAPSDPDGAITSLSHSAPSMVVLDTYRHLPQLYDSLEEKGCRLAVFDDHFRVVRRVDVIVNSSPIVKEEDYARGLANRFLLGPTYASLASSFVLARARYSVSAQVSRILIALGGADSCGNLPKLLAAVLPLLRDPVEVWVLSAHPVQENVPEHVKLNWGWLDQDSLARRMPDFDLAILAGGTMLWQAACVGVPTISWPQSPGQEAHAGAWQSKGAVVTIRELGDLSTALIELQPLQRRVQMSEAGRSLVDGRGSERIAACLYSMLEVGDAY